MSPQCQEIWPIFWLPPNVADAWQAPSQTGKHENDCWRWRRNARQGRQSYASSPSNLYTPCSCHSCIRMCAPSSAYDPP